MLALRRSQSTLNEDNIVDTVGIVLSVAELHCNPDGNITRRNETRHRRTKCCPGTYN